MVGGPHLETEYGVGVSLRTKDWRLCIHMMVSHFCDAVNGFGSRHLPSQFFLITHKSEGREGKLRLMASHTGCSL